MGTCCYLLCCPLTSCFIFGAFTVWPSKSGIGFRLRAFLCPHTSHCYLP